MNQRRYIAALVVALATTAAAAQTIERVLPQASASFSQPLPMRVHGRSSPETNGLVSGAIIRQWPGTYFETAFDGDAVAFRVGEGEVHLRISVDGAVVGSMMKPAPGLYEISGLKPERHSLRVDVASEDQANATGFGGFYLGKEAHPAPVISRARQIEFIGDSHTVGYGNTSTTRTCSPDEIFRTTDTSQSIAPRVAKHYGADYQVNAISGRGIVRNYAGSAGDTVPVAYPYEQFNKQKRYEGSGWRPQVIVIALGTNDFSTPLKSGEQWASRDALHRDYEKTYVEFLHTLRARNPDAYLLLWATDMADGEIAAEESKVVDQLHAAGDPRVGFLAVTGLQMTACNSHPSLADDQTIAQAIDRSIDAMPDIWGGKSGSTPAGTPTTGAVTVDAATGEAPAAQAATSSSTSQAERGAQIRKKLINDLATPWSVFGSTQTHVLMPDGGPSHYPAVRVTVAAKGTNPWDVGAVVPMKKPIAAGDVVLLAVFLRAPQLADGQTTRISYLGLNETSAPYDTVVGNAANVSNQWKVYYASAKAKQSYRADEIAAGIHLADGKNVLELGPVQVFDLGQDADLSKLPRNAP